MGILYYDPQNKVRATAYGEGLDPSQVDATFKKFYFDETKNPAVLEMFAARLATLNDVTILNDTIVQVAGKDFVILGRDVVETEAEAFYRSLDTYQTQMKTARTAWGSLTTAAEKQTFLANNFDKLLVILDGTLGFLKFLCVSILKVKRL
jgi:hypothetical protein